MDKKLEGNTTNIIFISVINFLLLTRLDNVKDKSGLTVEGLQEYYDEACLAVLNNRFEKCICPNLKIYFLNCNMYLSKLQELYDEQKYWKILSADQFSLEWKFADSVNIKGTKMGFSGMMCHASSDQQSSVRWGSLTFSSEISYLSYDSPESFLFGFNLYHLWGGPLEIYTVSSHLIFYNGCHCRTQMFRWLEWSVNEGWMSAGQPLDY